MTPGHLAHIQFLCIHHMLVYTCLVAVGGWADIRVDVGQNRGKTHQRGTYLVAGEFRETV